MRLFITFLLAITCFTSQAIDVTGLVTLNDSQDHSGIKIKFVPTSPVGNIDSTFSITDGSYSINLELGIYDIIISKEGYYNTSILEQTIVSSTIINDTTLIPLQIQTRDSIGGNLTGVLPAFSKYLVTEDITIPTNDSLIIEEGVELIFLENIKIHVLGKLLANGTALNPILFDVFNPTSDPSIKWSGFNGNNPNSIGFLRLDYTHINQTSATFNTSSEPEDTLKIHVSNSTIENSINVFVSWESAILIESCYFNNCHNMGHVSAAQTRINFMNNLVENSTGTGLLFGSNNPDFMSVQGNHFRNCETGIVIQGPNNLLVKDNTFNSCGVAIEIDYSLNFEIRNNTFFRNNYGIKFLNNPSYHKSLPIINNIFSSCDYGIDLNTIDDMLVEYNWFNCDIKNIVTTIPLLGQRITTNSSGDSTDIFLNVLGYDVNFVSTNEEDDNFLVLSNSSKAINNGENGTNIGSGEKGIEDEIITSFFEDKLDEFSIYPNPTTGKVFFEKPTEFQLLNIQGAIIKEEISNSIDLGTLQNGVYFIKTKDSLTKVLKN